jgi:hypothetical protein
MRKDKPGTGADAKGIKGLFRISRAGQDKFQEFFFPTKPRTPMQKKMFEAIVSVAETTDRWLRARAPA